MPVPTTIKKLRGFIRLAGYYRRFIQGFDIINKPLIDILKKDSFKCSPTAADPFEQLKEALTRATVLALPDASRIVVETDASGFGIRAVLMQQGHSIAFISKALSPRHAAMSVDDRELLAIVHAVSKWSQYLLGQN